MSTSPNTSFSSFNPSGQMAGAGPSTPRQGWGRGAGNYNNRSQGPEPRYNRGHNKRNASAPANSARTWRRDQGSEHAYPPRVNPHPQNNQNNNYRIHKDNRSGQAAFSRKNYRPPVRRAVDHDGDSTMTGMPYLYTKEQWRRIQQVVRRQQQQERQQQQQELEQQPTELDTVMPDITDIDTEMTDFPASLVTDFEIAALERAFDEILSL